MQKSDLPLAMDDAIWLGCHLAEWFTPVNESSQCGRNSSVAFPFTLLRRR